MILDLFGYDRHGEVRELKTTLQKNALNTRDVALAAMGFNAPAWIAAVSMSVLYSVVGAAAPLAILISFLFPMLVLALCLVYLTRQAPSAGGIFTFGSRFLHPTAGTILGWAYTIACVAVVPMTAIIGTQYLQALLPGLKGAFAANIIGTVVTLAFMLVCLRGVLLTARVTTVFLACEITVIVGLGILGIVSPHVAVPLRSLYAPPKDWTVLGVRSASRHVDARQLRLGHQLHRGGARAGPHGAARAPHRAHLGVHDLHDCRDRLAICGSRRDAGEDHRERRRRSHRRDREGLPAAGALLGGDPRRDQLRNGRSAGLDDRRRAHRIPHGAGRSPAPRIRQHEPLPRAVGQRRCHRRDRDCVRLVQAALRASISTTTRSS